jgi:hypothetical protein
MNQVMVVSSFDTKKAARMRSFSTACQCFLFVQPAVCGWQSSRRRTLMHDPQELFVVGDLPVQQSEV